MAGSTRTARLTAAVPTANNLFGLRFVYKSPRVSESETDIRTKLAENTIEIGDSCSSRRRNEKMKPRGATTGPEFHKAEYKRKLNEYCQNHSPAISRKVLEATIVDTLQGSNAESELTDFLGFGAIELIQTTLTKRYDDDDYKLNNRHHRQKQQQRGADHRTDEVSTAKPNLLSPALDGSIDLIGDELDLLNDLTNNQSNGEPLINNDAQETRRNVAEREE
ncbi:hypothetical protein WN51_07416 [Melipona quadrifasciata]|uniref:Uncharacterized protein n=1 Tax=Melipona quadrifasciata TaxID=166423 RepID=A0A0N0BC98_9HYME|nr:hypothetical protein WN51_07416 [Melipona quadrifasciata]